MLIWVNNDLKLFLSLYHELLGEMYVNIHLQITLFCSSHNVASGSGISPCNKIDKPLVVID